MGETKIGAPKEDWLSFIDLLECGKEMIKNVDMNVTKDMIKVSEWAKDNTAKIDIEWKPKNITIGDFVKITIDPNKILRALGTLADVGMITGKFDDKIAEFDDSRRYIKFQLPEASSQKEAKTLKFEKFLLTFDIDADVVSQIMSKAIQAMELTEAVFTITYKDGIVDMKVGDFTREGQEMVFPLTSSLAGATTDESEFTSSFNIMLQNIMKVGGKLTASIGKNYPIRLGVEKKGIKAMYIIAPAMVKK